MSTLDELLYYCKEENSFGALMLTGQWGCGKTYVIENDLSKKLSDSYIVIRISLFGVTSIKDIHQQVKKAYLESMMQNAHGYFDSAHVDPSKKGKIRVFNFFKKPTKKVTGLYTKVANSSKGARAFAFFKDLAKAIPGVGKFLSINPSDYISVENKIGNKNILLVFDDLERNSLREVDVLGCINEYCENKQVKTIIIANEEKMNTLGNQSHQNGEQEKMGESGVKISYKEIKEKLITRTIKCMPDYEKIITEILNSFNDVDGTYKKFLLNHKSDIVNVFMSGESENIRSLKCAIQDFQRVFFILVNSELKDDLDKYLLAFIAFVLCFKEGKVEKSEKYDYLFSDTVVEKMYPLYYRYGYMLKSIKEWVIEGEWNENKIKDEIEQILKLKKKPEPEFLVRKNSIIYLDEPIIELGFPKVVAAAYEGKLSIDEYVVLIENIAWARRNSFMLPVEVDMNRIEHGVSVSLHSMEESDEPDSQTRNFISDEEIKLLTDKEKQLYNTICEFREKNIQMFAKNRRLYLTALSKSNMTDMYQCENKRFNLFDKEMARAVVTFYKDLLNADRLTFNNLFRKMWGNSSVSQDMQKTESISGFEELKEELIKNKNEEHKKNHQLQAAFSEALIQIVLKIIKDITSSTKPID